ncbi:MAG: hypothetical protein R3A80_05700 [Bdellovibrionota bacterium]
MRLGVWSLLLLGVPACGTLAKKPQQGAASNATSAATVAPQTSSPSSTNTTSSLRSMLERKGRVKKQAPQNPKAKANSSSSFRGSVQRASNFASQTESPARSTDQSLPINNPDLFLSVKKAPLLRKTVTQDSHIPSVPRSTPAIPSFSPTPPAPPLPAPIANIPPTPIPTSAPQQIAKTQPTPTPVAAPERFLATPPEEEKKKETPCLDACNEFLESYENHPMVDRIEKRSDDTSVFALHLSESSGILWAEEATLQDPSKSKRLAFLEACKNEVTTKIDTLDRHYNKIIFRSVGSPNAQMAEEIKECKANMLTASRTGLQGSDRAVASSGRPTKIPSGASGSGGASRGGTRHVVMHPRFFDTSYTGHRTVSDTTYSPSGAVESHKTFDESGKVTSTTPPASGTSGATTATPSAATTTPTTAAPATTAPASTPSS